jgi:flagellar biosynthesis protein FlhF
MELQRILARDTRSAMEKVFNLYGNDAMIVANNKVKGQTEIIVAIDLISEVKAALNKTPDVTRDADASANFSAVMETQVLGHQGSEASAYEADNGIVFGSASQPVETRTTAKMPALDPLVGLSMDNVTNAINGENYKAAADREYLKAREIVDLVKQELSVMRDEFKLAQQKDSWTGTLAVSEEMRPLIEAFNETGMPLGLRESVIEVINQSDSMGQAIAEISSAIGDELESVDLLSNMQGVHVIAGSSGAGKTLMAGRLANQMAQQYGENNVALISFNDVRIGAWSQMQMIGSQAGVDTFRASSIDMLSQLMAEIGERKLVIIDTSGVDIEHQLSQLDEALPEAQKHLLIAADASEASARRQLNQNTRQWDSVMLSRFEDGTHPWAIIYLLLNHPVPLSVAAVRPTIADDAIPLNGLTLAGQALSQLPIHFV